jgi:hypothetical protein
MDDLRHFQTIQSFDNQILEKSIADWAQREIELASAPPEKSKRRGTGFRRPDEGGYTDSRRSDPTLSAKYLDAPSAQHSSVSVSEGRSISQRRNRAEIQS